MIVVAERCGIIFLHEAPLRLPRCEQAAGYAVSETRRRDAGKQPFRDLFDAGGQKAERLECEQRARSCQWRAGGEPNEHP